MLTPADWELIGFYQLVADQWVNQTPMGGAKGMPAIVTPRLEGYEAALRIYGYPRQIWPALAKGAALIHRLMHKMDKVIWIKELGKAYGEVTPEDVADGDP